jgi:hypothetical protein
MIACALRDEIARRDCIAADASAAALRGLVVMLRQDGGLRLTPGPGSASAYRHPFTAIEAFGSGPALSRWEAALRGADALQVRDEMVAVLRDGFASHPFPRPTDVQIRVFG